MKSVFRVFLFAAFLVAIAHSYPGATRDSESSQDDQQQDGVGTVLVLPGRRKPFPESVFEDPDLEDDSLDAFQSPGFYIPFSINPFNDYLTGVMKRLREQMSKMLSLIPESTIVSNWGKVPEGANTTSTTKIVDGHVVTINETTYSSGNDTNGAVIRVRIIDVKPQNDTFDTVGVDGGPEPVTTESSESEITTGLTEDSSTPARSVETVENELNNEIPKSQIELLNA